MSLFHYRQPVKIVAGSDRSQVMFEILEVAHAKLYDGGRSRRLEQRKSETWQTVETLVVELEIERSMNFSRNSIHQ